MPMPSASDPSNWGWTIVEGGRAGPAENNTATWRRSSSSRSPRPTRPPRGVWRRSSRLGGEDARVATGVQVLKFIGPIEDALSLKPGVIPSAARDLEGHEHRSL